MTVGTDITEVERIQKIITAHPEFISTVFTGGEIAYCQRKKNKYQHFAARFAAKESVMKAIGKGWLQGIQWTDIEVETLSSGEPAIKAHGTLLRAMEEKKITSLAVSLSHCRAYALAFVVAV
ncbi:MAG: holo-ACP synthase [Pseudomonadota bacterium]